MRQRDRPRGRDRVWRKYEGWRDRREREKSENMSEIRKYEGEGERAHIKTGEVREIIK